MCKIALDLVTQTVCGKLAPLWLTLRFLGHPLRIVGEVSHIKFTKLPKYAQKDRFSTNVMAYKNRNRTRRTSYVNGHRVPLWGGFSRSPNMIHDSLLLLKQILDCVRRPWPPSVFDRRPRARAQCRSGFGEEWVAACGASNCFWHALLSQ